MSKKETLQMVQHQGQVDGTSLEVQKDNNSMVIEQ
jgi:hypothetical protein